MSEFQHDYITHTESNYANKAENSNDPFEAYVYKSLCQTLLTQRELDRGIMLAAGIRGCYAHMLTEYMCKTAAAGHEELVLLRVLHAYREIAKGGAQ